jgi:hypothetical protein
MPNEAFFQQYPKLLGLLGRSAETFLRYLGYIWLNHHHPFWHCEFFVHDFLGHHVFVVGGHSKTTWTNFCPILTTYLPIVEFRRHLLHYLPFVHVDIKKTNHLSSCLCEFDNIYLVLQLLTIRRR